MNNWDIESKPKEKERTLYDDEDSSEFGTVED
jgi:hypothetical protein